MQRARSKVGSDVLYLHSLRRLVHVHPSPVKQFLQVMACDAPSDFEDHKQIEQVSGQSCSG